jgi:hypothetical protein
MPKVKNVMAVIVTVGLLVLALPFILAYAGIGFGGVVNPLELIAYSAISVTPACVPAIQCWINEESISVAITKQSTVAILKPESLTFVPTCTLPIIQYGQIKIRFKIPSLNYDYTMPLMGFKAICDSPVREDFRFNYKVGQCYDWIVEIYGTGDRFLFSKIGRTCL